MSGIKCAFCDHKTLPWTNTRGQSAYNRLMSHVQDEHPEEFKQLKEKIREYITNSGIDTLSESEIGDEL